MSAIQPHQQRVIEEKADLDAQIARDFGYASPNSAQCTLDQIEAKGYLVRNELGRRMFARPVLAAARQASAEVTA